MPKLSFRKRVVTVDGQQVGVNMKFIPFLRVSSLKFKEFELASNNDLKNMFIGMCG